MDTEMLNIVSERLRSQSLEEIATIDESKVEKINKDSGTESDEELTSITKDMASPSSPSLVEMRRSSGCLQAGHHEGLQEGLLVGPLPNSCSPVPTFHLTPPLPTDPSLHGSDDFELDAGSSSTECSVDYGDAFPRPPVLVSVGAQLAGFPSMDKISDCDSELANLLKDVHTPPEEQDVDFEDDVEEDRSPVNRCGSCGSVSASEDEEVGATLERKSPAPLRFRTSPPRGVHKLNKRTISPKVFLASTVSPYSNARFHRHHRLIQRPHLDFEKMQVTRNTRILYSVM